MQEHKFIYRAHLNKAHFFRKPAKKICRNPFSALGCWSYIWPRVPTSTSQGSGVVNMPTNTHKEKLCLFFSFRDKIRPPKAEGYVENEEWPYQVRLKVHNPVSCLQQQPQWMVFRRNKIQ